jgi:hypothetical protein
VSAAGGAAGGGGGSRKGGRREAGKREGGGLREGPSLPSLRLGCLSPRGGERREWGVVYLPVRHHSPACAFQTEQVIRALRPAAVLVEGPRDASGLIDYLANPATRAPVAIYTAFVDRRGDGLPARFGAYYPMCDYSPELAALRTAHALGVPARFIDLTYPEMVVAELGVTPPTQPAGRAPVRSLQDEGHLRRSRFLAAACREAGARDVDDLWDCLFEHDFRRREPEVFFNAVLAWCALSRLDYTAAMLAQEIHDVREAGMRHEIDAAVAASGGRPVVVVTGGFHAVALPDTKPALPKAVVVARPEDSSVTLMRYGFVQLDRLNGYASGMPSPELYQRIWEERDPLDLVVEIARALRELQGAPSSADAMAATLAVQSLARFRNHQTPTREDLLDGLRSLFIKGSDEVEGVAVLAVARKHLAGDRVGEVPAGAGRPPLVLDFERTAEALRVPLEAKAKSETALDLFRKAAHRARSRFFHRLRLLEVPFAEWVRGPDYVAGKNLDRIEEVWCYGWEPATEAHLIEKSRYGATLEEAAAACILEKVALAEGDDLRSDLAAGMLLEACRCGLHAHAPALLARTAGLVAHDSSFASVVGAALSLDLLRVAREPLEAHDLPGVEQEIRAAWERAAGLVPALGATGENEEAATLDRLCAWSALVPALPDPDLAAGQRAESLRGLFRAGGNPAVVGVAAGLLYDDGELAGEELGRQLAGRLGGACGDPSLGARFLRGILRAARSACWREAPVLDAVHATLLSLPEAEFIAVLPHLRLAFGDLTPRECDRVALAVAARTGDAAPRFERLSASEADVLLGLRVDLLLGEALARDGLAGDDHV